MGLRGGNGCFPFKGKRDISDQTHRNRRHDEHRHDLKPRSERWDSAAVRAMYGISGDWLFAVLAGNEMGHERFSLESTLAAPPINLRKMAAQINLR